MCTELCFEIPYPIGTNAAYRIGIMYVKGKPRARMYMTAEGKSFKRDVEMIARAAMNCAGFDVGKKDRLGWQFELYPSDLRKDMDGGIKLTQDAIADAFGINDKRFDEGHIYKRAVDKDNPRVAVYVWKL